MEEKKLILFIHGFGGDKKTWGEFEKIIDEDESFDKNYDIEFYKYNTSKIEVKFILSKLGSIGIFLSLFFKNSPKIQNVSELLSSDILGEYEGYNNIYLVAHSMGGLVALKYIVDELNHKKPLKIKKLLLYDVPNKGSFFAKISFWYKHPQIIQLDKSSDFLDSLNNSYEFKTIEEQVKVKSIICQNGNIVDKDSAKAHYTDIVTLDRTHTGIVKPSNEKDNIYRHFKNFIVDDICNEECQFIKDIFNNLPDAILILIHQNNTIISPINKEIKLQAERIFGKYLHHYITAKETNIEFYKRLGASIDKTIENSQDFVYVMEKIINKQKKKNKQEILLYINSFDNIPAKIKLEFIDALIKLKSIHYNFHVIIMGKDKLINMAYHHNTPIKPAIIKIFPNNQKLEPTNIKSLINSLKYDDITILEEYLRKEDIGYLDIDNPIIMKLFKSNIITSKDNKELSWKDKDTEEKVKLFISEREK